jgi:hypothetical protein
MVSPGAYGGGGGLQYGGMNRGGLPPTRGGAPPSLASALTQQLNALSGGGQPTSTVSGPWGNSPAGSGGPGSGSGPASPGPTVKSGPASPVVTSSVGGSVPGAAGGPISNTSAPDPNAQWLVDELKKRMTGQGSTQQAMDIAGSQIRDIGVGTSKGITEDMARRGISGSGVEANLQGRLAQDLQREQAGSATNIALDRQRQIDALALGSGGIFSAPGQLQQGSQSLALQQYLGSGDLALRKYLGEGNLDVARQGQNFSQQQALLNSILQLYQ